MRVYCNKGQNDSRSTSHSRLATETCTLARARARTNEHGLTLLTDQLHYSPESEIRIRESGVGTYLKLAHLDIRSPRGSGERAGAGHDSPYSFIRCYLLTQPESKHAERFGCSTGSCHCELCSYYLLLLVQYHAAMLLVRRAKIGHWIERGRDGKSGRWMRIKQGLRCKKYR